MGRNNICVIYDSDENYAKRLMSVINDDNDIPYNAQVFTKEHELDKYLQEKEADMLTFICISASYVRLAAHVSNGLKSRIHPVVGRI